MKFRPCIDIHNGKVKQIVGGSLRDQGDQAEENFVSEQDAAYYARFYKKNFLKGGHIIMLNSVNSSAYEATKEQALKALRSYEKGFQIGGGITDKNAEFFLENGASHVIVTSFVFKNGEIDFENLDRIFKITGKKSLVLDLSCRRRGEEYYIVTDRWQKFTDVTMSSSTLNLLSKYCDEFLIHAVDVEGKSSGIEAKLAELLGNWEGIPITYAGGVGDFEDLKKLKELGKGRLDVTIGSALDLFGGPMSYVKVLEELEGK